MKHIFIVNPVSGKGKNAKNYASQGQIRTAVLCLKLAQMEIIKEETDEFVKPTVIMKDGTWLPLAQRKQMDFMYAMSRFMRKNQS